MTNIGQTSKSICCALGVLMCFTLVVGCPSRRYLDKTKMVWVLPEEETAMAKRDLGVYANTIKTQTTDEVISSIEEEPPKGSSTLGRALTACRNYLRERELASRGTNAITELAKYTNNIMSMVYVGPSAPVGSVGDMCKHRIKEALGSACLLSNGTNMYLWTAINAETAPLLEGCRSD